MGLPFPHSHVPAAKNDSFLLRKLPRQSPAAWGSGGRIALFPRKCSQAAVTTCVVVVQLQIFARRSRGKRVVKHLELLVCCPGVHSGSHLSHVDLIQFQRSDLWSRFCRVSVEQPPLNHGCKSPQTSTISAGPTPGYSPWLFWRTR